MRDGENKFFSGTLIFQDFPASEAQVRSDVLLCGSLNFYLVRPMRRECSKLARLVGITHSPPPAECSIVKPHWRRISRQNHVHFIHALSFGAALNSSSAERVVISLRLAFWVHHLGLSNNDHESPLQQQAQEITRIFPASHLPDNPY